MTLHRIRQTAFWGDYGTILAGGLARRDPNTGILHLERAGPFAPPLMITHEHLEGRVPLVTHSLRGMLEAADFGALAFKPTLKKHIVEIPWQTWDRKARVPWDEYATLRGDPPEEGEPENYILGQDHSPRAASEMEEIWEFIAPELPCRIARREHLRAFHRRWYITHPTGQHKGLFRPDNGKPILFVDDERRRWFEQKAEGWVDFDEVVIV